MNHLGEKHLTLLVIGGGELGKTKFQAFEPLVKMAQEMSVIDFVDAARMVLSQIGTIAIARADGLIVHAGDPKTAMEYSIAFDDSLSYHQVDHFNDQELISLWGILRTHIESLTNQKIN